MRQFKGYSILLRLTLILLLRNMVLTIELTLMDAAVCTALEEVRPMAPMFIFNLHTRLTRCTRITATMLEI